MWYKGAVFILASVLWGKLKSSFQICIPISCKSTFFDKNEIKKSLWGDNRENMVNILSFMHSCSKILKHLSLSTLYFFFKRFTKCWGAELQHYSHWPSQLYIKVKTLKGFLFTPFYRGHVVPQTCNEGLYKQARWGQYDYNVWHSDKIL